MTCRHSGRHVYVALGYVFDCATTACALRWGVAFVRDYHYWAFLTPSWDHILGVGQFTSGQRSLEAEIEKKFRLWL